MLTTSKILSDLILQYVASVTQIGGEYRIVVPGLTMAIGEEVHASLRAAGINSYLTINNLRGPDETKRWLLPASLTNMRIGSFVAIADPGALSEIRDSIRGSGGAIRSIGFSEEWPWIDDGSEAFQFRGPFASALVGKWAQSKEERAWLHSFLLDGLVAATRRLPDRASLLLEGIIGSFDPSSPPSVAGISERFLFHCGVPRPTAIGDDARHLVLSTRSLVKRITERARKESDLRRQVLERVPVDDPEAEALRSALHAFFDGLAAVSSLDGDLLALRKCWGSDSDKLRNWCLLTAERLRELFEVQDVQPIKLICSWLSGQGVLVSDDGLSAACIPDSTFQVRAQFEIPPDDFQGADCQIQVTIRGTQAASAQLSASAGDVTLSFCAPHLGVTYRSRLPVTVTVLKDGNAIGKARLVAHCCGEQRPAFVVATPGFWVANAEDISDDPSPAQRHSVDGPVTLHLFSLEGAQPEIRHEDGRPEQPKKDSNGIWSTASPLNPLDAPAGQVTCTCQMGARWVTLTFEMEDIVRGEFTLEDELRCVIAAGRVEAAKAILKIFDGASTEPYPRLGGINKQSLRRVRLAKCFEDRAGWQPILTDLLAGAEGTAQACGDFARSVGPGADSRAIAAATLPTQAQALVQNYAEKRDAFRIAVLGILPGPFPVEEHPDYATHPFFLSDEASGRGALESALQGYLAAYCQIREHLRSHVATLTWEQAFLLSYLDCAVNWRDGRSKGTFFLLGPWHPLVAAKRFMVQRALVLRARRLVTSSDRSFGHLAGLLGEVPGFSWHHALKAEDTSFEIAYVAATTDPGWHFAFKREATEVVREGAIERILVESTKALRETLGLEARVRLPSTSAMVRTVLNGYIRTFPSKRHLGIYLSAGFPGEEELAQSNTFLHQEGGPTMAGEQLPGGVSASFSERPSVPEGVQWTDPPLKIFLYPERADCIREQHPNIHFSGSGDDVKFLDLTDGCSLPRGREYDAVFSQPLSRLVQGQTSISQSVSIEWEQQSDAVVDGIGGHFLRACRLNCALAGPPKGIVRPANLPQSLDATWTVVPGTVLDPAVFVRYVRDGRSRALEERALWDYRISVARASTSYFVLSTIPGAFRSSLGGIFPGAPSLATECITELGQIGLAIGGEAMKSGRHALGTLGIVAAVRLFGAAGGQLGPLAWNGRSVGFLIPIDSFLGLLDDQTGPDDEEPKATDRRRGDLLAMVLSEQTGDKPRLHIEAVVVECKFTGATLDEQYASEALGQSRRSMERFSELCLAARNEDGLPERLALLQLVRFGLRISGGHEADHPDRIPQEQAIYNHLLQGQFDLVATKSDSLLVSTELALPGTAETSKTGGGLWIRLNKQHWPGVADTQSVEVARRAIGNLFAGGGGIVASGSPPPAGPTLPSSPSETLPPALTEPPVKPIVEPPADGLPYPDLTPETTPLAAEGLPAQPEPEGVMLRPPILVGMDSSRRSVYFDPHSPVDRLDNANAMITGNSGKGKTQLVKYMIAAIRERGANALLLDFKNDFVSDPHFIAGARLNANSVAFDGIPFNPLIPFPMPHPRSGELFIQCAQHITGIAAVFRRTYALGAQQEAAVKNAIREAFSGAGVDPNGVVPFNPETTFPDLASVGEILRESNTSAYNRLDPLFTLDLFREQYWRSSFASLVGESTVLDFSQLPSDELKNALAELVVLSAHSFFNSQPHCGLLKQVFVIDEAHRVLRADFLGRFAKECRAYGVSLLLSSQYPSDFPPDISSSMATKIIHGNDRDVDRVRAITNLLNCSGREASIADLGMFEAIFSNKHFRNVAIRTITYPLHLVISALEHSGALTLDEIGKIPGIDPQKLSPGNIVFHLERLGLCESVDGRVRMVRRDS